MIVWLWAAGAFAGDKDHDGVPNKTDTCKEEPEDLDEFQDEDGCPDPDNDADGVLDASDTCPDELEDKAGAADGCPEVSLELLSSDGYMAAVQNLMTLVVEAAGKAASGEAEEGCRTLGFGAKGWLQKNDTTKLGAVWDARLKRAPEGFDRHGAEQLLRQKADVYRTAKPAVDVFCKDDQGWTAVAEKVDAVFAPIPAAEPPPKPTKKKR